MIKSLHPNPELFLKVLYSGLLTALVVYANVVAAQTGQTLYFDIHYDDFRKVDTSFIERRTKLNAFLFPVTYTSQRTYNPDSVIYESEVLCVAKNEVCSMQYKKLKNGNWATYFGGEKHIFFNNRKQKLKKVPVYSDTTYLQPLPARKIKNETVYGFCKLYKDGYSSQVPVYWFHPKFGVIAFRGQGYIFVRRDFYRAISGS